MMRVGRGVRPLGACHWAGTLVQTLSEVGRYTFLSACFDHRDLIYLMHGHGVVHGTWNYMYS